MLQIITLDKPITAQDWRLNVITSDNGTPWKAIRIYNWKMYEKLVRKVSIFRWPRLQPVLSKGNTWVQVGFADVAAGATITVYDNPNSPNSACSLEGRSWN